MTNSATATTESGSVPAEHDLPPAGTTVRIALGLMVLLYAVIAVSSLARKSVTVDEFAHLPVGYNVLTTGDFGYAQLNPPLMNVLNALPLAAMQGSGARTPIAVPRELVALDAGYDLFANGYHFMFAHAANYQRELIAARCVTVLVVGLLAVLVFAWARRLAHTRANLAGLLAAGLVLFSPNMIAHGRLVTTDAGAAASMTLGLFALHQFLRRPGRWSAAALGGALGLALLVKFTAVYLYPVAVIAAVVWQRLRRPPTARSLASGLAIALGVSLLVINVGYGFQGSMTLLGDFELSSAAFRTLQSGLPDFLPVPVPAVWLTAFDLQTHDVVVGDQSYLLGESFFGGRWYYFPIILAAKTPLPTLLLGLLAIGLAVRHRDAVKLDALLLLLPIALFFTVLFFLSNKQLGMRMVLPVLPLWWTWLAVVIARAPRTRWLQWTAITLAAWVAVESVRVWPDYLSYFNPLFGGRDQAYEVAVDSNLDWGQDLIQLRDVLDREGVEQVQLLYFGRADPALYGIDYEVPLSGELKPGLFAISNTLLGVGYVVYDHGQLQLAGPFTLDPAILGEPIAQPGYSIRVYRIPPPVATM